VTPPSPIQESSHEAMYDVRHSRHSLDNSDYLLDYYDNAGLEAPGLDSNRLSVGFRPLPPEDPSDDPEQRANRIRSFYKEYFDDNKPGTAAEDGQYYEDYDQEYLTDTPYYDTDMNSFVMNNNAPFAEPVTRRAMTPPPRAPPRFQGPLTSRNVSSSMSFGSGRYLSPGPRAYSSQSGRFGVMGPARNGPKRPIPPPAALRTLPTPYKLKEDAFAMPIEFAPPSTYRDRAAGHPESRLGGLRPYSRAVRAHIPLTSSFDDLTVMPSP